MVLGELEANGQRQSKLPAHLRLVLLLMQILLRTDSVPPFAMCSIVAMQATHLIFSSFSRALDNCAASMCVYSGLCSHSEPSRFVRCTMVCRVSVLSSSFSVSVLRFASMAISNYQLQGFRISCEGVMSTVTANSQDVSLGRDPKARF
jgi:hypothetical protein